MTKTFILFHELLPCNVWAVNLKVNLNLKQATLNLPYSSVYLIFMFFVLVLSLFFTLNHDRVRRLAFYCWTIHCVLQFLNDLLHLSCEVTTKWKTLQIYLQNVSCIVLQSEESVNFLYTYVNLSFYDQYAATRVLKKYSKQ